MRTAARCPFTAVWGGQQLNPVRGSKPRGFQAHTSLRTHFFPAARCRELIAQLGPLQPRRVHGGLHGGVQCHSVPRDLATGTRRGQESLSPRKIAAGEVHIYWLDPHQVCSSAGLSDGFGESHYVWGTSTAMECDLLCANQRRPQVTIALPAGCSLDVLQLSRAHIISQS